VIRDNPLETVDQDKLGFGEMAQHLASSFLNNDLSCGFVVGVEGPWGSGKSSLVNLALDSLNSRQDGPKVLRFAPWLIGNRSELLAQLFADLQPLILSQLPDAERLQTKALLGRYAQLSSGLATLADFAEIGGVPWASKASKFLRLTSKRAETLSERSLGELNHELREKLLKLDRPIVVFIDDLDRLEPKEAAEVLRLVKAVADFPNVAYILAYDFEILSQSIQRAVEVPNGASYLEKVIQASFKVPAPMKFDLQNWLQVEVEELVSAKDLTEGERTRLNQVLRLWCRIFVDTPRDAVRILNSLRLNYLPVKDKVDLADMVFLQMVRLKNTKLFNWIEEYVTSLAAVGDWGYLFPDEPTRMGQSLLATIEAEGDELNRVLYALDTQLPGIDTASFNRERSTFKVFSLNGNRVPVSYSTEKRLGSPNHYRYYFAFSKPVGSISDDDVSRFLLACSKSPLEATQKFREYIAVKRPQGGRIAEVLLSRLLELSDVISTDEVCGLFTVLADSIDELIPYAKTEFGSPRFLRGQREEVFGLIYNIKSSEVRLKLLDLMFSHGTSMAWLTGIIREANFYHGPFRDHGRSENDGLLSNSEYEIIREIFISRLNGSSKDDLLSVPLFLSLMYGWSQTGDQDGPITWIALNTEADADFIEVLEHMQSWSESSDRGVQYKLQTDTLKSFFGGASLVANRLSEIKFRSERAPGLASRAEDLLAKFDK
jgi:hypothetical protein